MVRRVSGDPATGPYEGGPEEADDERRGAQEARARREAAPRPVPGRAGPRRHQYRCPRCGGLWPSGWPGARTPGGGRRPPEPRCPDCGYPGAAAGDDVPVAREHSTIDLHWLMSRFAPLDPGPCPVCGARREFADAGLAPGTVYRPLDWACPSDDAWSSRFDPDGHYWTALEPVRWESEAAHHAYWLAADLLRVAAQAGEVTELPIGAEYQSLDGGGEYWVYDEGGWRLACEI
ncbi:hypothetical protein [Nocardiopsis sp. YSL2]|uniref:hypothetical protein n=1 Tax=Nocardiopsis sp. YSL2 TaxID=2939492 RepID=UPI0026F43F77|nr:hypothetical protein [Nocardiopsis sp. YSL2]